MEILVPIDSTKAYSINFGFSFDPCNTGVGLIWTTEEQTKEKPDYGFNVLLYLLLISFMIGIGVVHKDETDDWFK